MTGTHRFFIQHFILCLAAVCIFALAGYSGWVTEVWQEDLSHVTSIIALLVLGSAIYLGWQCWSVSSSTHILFGVFVAGLCPMLGLLGTTQGLKLNITALTNGSSGLLPLSTSVTAMQVGVIGSIIVGILTFNLHMGIMNAENGDNQ